MGSHPLGAMLWLKRREGLARNGQPILPVAVSAEVADLSRVVPAGQQYLVSGWRDVENWGMAIVTFSDHSRAVVHASDIVLGGMESRLQVLLSNCQLECNLSPNDLLRAYGPDEAVFGQEYLQEKLGTRSGWSTPMPDEDWTSGHQAMCQDFASSVAEGRSAVAEGALGVEVIRVLYSAYVAAAEQRRVVIEGSR
jgi:predicted dehydrogenase